MSDHVVTIVLRIVLDPGAGIVKEAVAEPSTTGTATISTAGVRRAERVNLVRWMLRAEPAISGPQVARELGVSAASAKRYLADARALNES